MSNEDNRTDVALTSSEQEFRLLVDTIPMLVWSGGSDGNIDYVNRRALEYFGAPLSEIIGWGWAERVHPDDIAFKTRTWLANLESGIAHDAVCRFRRADGQYRWFAISGAPLKAGDGRVIRWHGVLIDIDDRRKAEEALRETEYKLRQIIETVPTFPGQRSQMAKCLMSISAFWTIAACDLRILSNMVGAHSCILTTFRKL